MAKTTLTAETTVGTFTRKTDVAYTHVVVRSSECVKREIAARDRLFGVFARFAKDGGFITSWHSSAAAAAKAAAGPNGYARDSVVVGIFEVAN